MVGDDPGTQIDAHGDDIRDILGPHDGRDVTDGPRHRKASENGVREEPVVRRGFDPKIRVHEEGRMGSDSQVRQGCDDEEEGRRHIAAGLVFFWSSPTPSRGGPYNDGGEGSRGPCDAEMPGPVGGILEEVGNYFKEFRRRAENYREDNDNGDGPPTRIVVGVIAESQGEDGCHQEGKWIHGEGWEWEEESAVEDGARKDHSKIR